MNRTDVDRTSPVPLYYQIKETLKEKIENGPLEPHQRLPSERELKKNYGISRMTARRALSELESEGYAYREQGKGSFVAEPKLRQGLLELTSFTEDMRDRGLKPGSRVLSTELISLNDEELSSKLKTSKDEQIFVLRRVRMADEEPLAIESSHLRYTFCEGIEETDFSNQSLYETLREDFNLTLGKADQTVEATLASEFESKILHVPEGSPMLATERVTYLNDGDTPIELARSTYRGDRYKMGVKLTR